jgi:hypothetical protein
MSRKWDNVVFPKEIIVTKVCGKMIQTKIGETFMDKLINFSKKQINVAEIKELYYINDHKELVSFINQCISEGVLSPCKSSKKTYQIPQIYEKYHIVHLKSVNDDMLHEISYKLSHKLYIDYYKSHTGEYEEVREYVLKLSDYLKTNKNMQISLSLNERSFDIFGNEKFLGTKLGQSILTKLQVSYDDLCIYKTPEPFFYYINDRSDSKNVLIIENKDTWYTIKNLLKQNKKVLGIDFKAIIYGEGRKIQRTFADINYEEYNRFNSQDNVFYYFGDIDSYGVDILYFLISEYGAYKIIPFYKAYSVLLLNLNRKRNKEDKQNISLDIDKIKLCFKEYQEDTFNHILSICNENYILPQEILNNSILGSYEDA